MKNLLYFMFAAVVFSACGSDDVEVVKKSNGKLDPSAMVRIEADKGVRLRSSETEVQYTEDGEPLLSALEITKQGVAMAFHSFYASGKPYDHYTSRGFGDWMRDTISPSPALLMFSTDIIDQQGKLYKTFIYAEDVVVVRVLYNPEREDTIAYIPNAVLKAAREKIETAYNDSNYTEVYRLFNEAYKFRPTTGKQWRKLKEKGLQ